MNIYEKLVEVRKSIDGFSKDKKSYNYDYVTGNQILRKIKVKMDELGIVLIPQVNYDTFNWCKHEYLNSKDKECLDFLVQAQMIYKWVNAEEPTDFIEVPWLMVGQQADDISKAVGTALTYNERYFLLKQFGLPTDEDDADNRQLDYGGKSNNKSNNNISKKITEAQSKRLFAIGKGKDTNSIKAILSNYGYSSSKDILIKDYDKICKEIESL